MWRSLVAYIFWEDGVAGSSPVTPTDFLEKHAIEAGDGRSFDWFDSLVRLHSFGE